MNREVTTVSKTRVEVIEIEPDATLQKKEAIATRTLRRFFPKSGPVRLYRTADGKVGFEAKLALVSGDRKRLDEAYRELMKAIGEHRGRPRGPETVQAKLRLRADVYKKLKQVAKARNTTMSEIVTESVLANIA